MVDNNEHLLEFRSKLDKVCSGIDVVQGKQQEMSEDIAKIKEAVYNPDSGLYARLRALEQWKENQAKIQWTLTTTVIGLVLATVYKALFSI